METEYDIQNRFNDDQTIHIPIKFPYYNKKNDIFENANEAVNALVNQYKEGNRSLY